MALGGDSNSHVEDCCLFWEYQEAPASIICDDLRESLKSGAALMNFLLVPMHLLCSCSSILGMICWQMQW
jgi:hypothetical protein